MFKKTIATTLLCTLFAVVGCGSSGNTLTEIEESGKPVPNPQSDRDPYSTASKITYSHTDWMSHIPDATPLLDMSIPGAIAPWDKGPYFPQQYLTWHQVIPVTDQLTAGLRAFDMRMAVDRTSSTGLAAVGVHVLGSAGGSANPIKDTFNAIGSFLPAHPTETVIVRVTYVGDGTDKDTWGTKVTALFQSMWGNAYTSDIVWQPQSAQEVAHPTMGNVRGKLVIIRSSENSGLPSVISQDGIDDSAFRDLTLEEQNLTSIGSLYGAWNNVRSQLGKINDAHKTADSGKGGITALSAGGGAYPSFAASGFDSWKGYPLSTGRTTSLKDIYPDFNHFTCTLPNGKGICSVYYTGLNFLTNDSLLHISSRAGDHNEAMSHYKNLGIVFISFPGESLIKAIINTNSSITRPE